MTTGPISREAELTALRDTLIATAKREAGGDRMVVVSSLMSAAWAVFDEAFGPRHAAEAVRTIVNRMAELKLARLSPPAQARPSR